MPKQVVKTVLPTTMVGSYPRPGWFKQQLLGRDIRVAFKEVSHEEAYVDAVATIINDWGGVINNGTVDKAPDALRWPDLYDIAKNAAGNVPVKVSIGAGPANLAWHVYFNKDSYYKNAKELTFALCPIFNKEMKELVKHGATYLQIEDLGAWLPLFSNNQDDYKWIRESIEMMCDGVDAKIGWHFCFGNAW